LGSPHDISGAAHLPGKTALRIEGVAPSVEARLRALRELLADSGAKMEELGTLESRVFWREVRDVAPLKGTPDAVVWKISCPPTEGPAIVGRIKAQRPAAEAYYDWSGGLVWLALPASADADHATYAAPSALRVAMRRLFKRRTPCVRRCLSSSRNRRPRRAGIARKELIPSASSIPGGWVRCAKRPHAEDTGRLKTG
jgi:hypothetical protein